MAAPTPLMAMAGLPWASYLRALGTQTSALSFKGNHTTPQNKGLRLRFGPSGAWKWAVSAPNIKQKFLLEEKVSFEGRGDSDVLS